MNKAKSTMKLFGLIGLLILWNCSCVDRHRSHALCEQSLIDSLEVRAQDSLFSNLPYSRSLLRNAMRQAQDSMSYYRLMGLYGKTFFISSDFDSILYYNRPVKEYDKRAAACPRWNDVLSDVYNIEGNVWMQLNQPDSAVAYYEKSYAYRLKGDKAHLLSDICMNLAGFPSVDYAAHTIVIHMMDYGTTRFELGIACAIATILFLLTFGTNLLVRKLLRRVGN